MKKEKKPEQFIRQPSYRGGVEAMKQFVKENLRYPEDALKNHIEGTVAVAYEIDHLGNVIDAKIKSGLGYGCDEEAIRITKMLKFGVPPHRGLRVMFHKTINIHFRLPNAPAPKPVAGNTQFVYNYTEKKRDERSGYSYTISVKS